MIVFVLSSDPRLNDHLALDLLWFLDHRGELSDLLALHVLAQPPALCARGYHHGHVPTR